MLNNRKVYLYMIRQAKTPLPPSKAQLLMFLCMQKSPTKHYQFIPTEEGPVSLVLEGDTIAMLKKALLVENGQKGSSGQILKINAEHYAEKMMPKDEDKQLLEATLEEYQEKSELTLLKIAITMKPFFGIHLCDEKATMLDNQTRSEIVAIQTTIKDSTRALYTIGYEKISLDACIQALLINGIQTVIDVRETTVSRRREFSKKALTEALGKARIAYISIPEIGIPSEVRKKLLEQGDHQDLLLWYRKNVLPKSGAYAKRVNDILKQGNTALLCYEKDPKECHRSVFAQFCRENYPEIPAIIPLRDTEESLLEAFILETDKNY